MRHAGPAGHPSVVAKIEEVVGLARARSMATGVFAPTPAGARSWFHRGVVLVGLGVDTGHILAGLSGARAAAMAADGPEAGGRG
jgi:2-keto-3-deoxy-L-rhamnonate aldolase RhmA